MYMRASSEITIAIHQIWSSAVSGNESCQSDVEAHPAADTVVIFPPERITAEASANGSTVPGMQSQILEKPSSKEDQFRMLDLMAGKECEVITGVTIGMSLGFRL